MELFGRERLFPVTPLAKGVENSRRTSLNERTYEPVAKVVTLKSHLWRYIFIVVVVVVAGACTTLVYNSFALTQIPMPMQIQIEIEIQIQIHPLGAAAQRLHANYSR